MNPNDLLERFLGPDAARSAGNTARGVGDTLNAGGLGGFGGGMAAGGLLGLLVGSKQMRKMAGGAVGYGGAAVLGALAYRAYQNWQAGKAPAQGQAATSADANAAAGFLPPQASDGRPFALVLVLAMIGAAKADNHIGPDEQKLIFDKVGALGLDPESKAFVFDALSRPLPVSEIAALANGPEQASEIYLASRLAIDPDRAEEKHYLEALAHRLKLPPPLVEHLERQVALQTPAAA